MSKGLNPNSPVSFSKQAIGPFCWIKLIPELNVFYKKKYLSIIDLIKYYIYLILKWFTYLQYYPCLINL